MAVSRGSAGEGAWRASMFITSIITIIYMRRLRVYLALHLRGSSWSRRAGVSFRRCRDDMGPPQTYESIVGSSAATDTLRTQIASLADSKASILITGESGVGKDLVARELHAKSGRRANPFIAINCAALSPGILESELFGHGRGSFTGAVRSHAGFFEQAQGGTLFLDEIGEMPPPMQAKLLRVLQNRAVRRMGEAVVRPVSFRLISATNADLETRIESGAFRLDLLYRINVVEIAIPPLRQRTEDIADLIAHFFRRRGRVVPEFTPEVRDRLVRYQWPGNVREVENEVERLATLYAHKARIELNMLSSRITNHRNGNGRLDIRMLYESPLPQAVCELEQEMLRRALERTNWNKSRTARKLGLSRQGLLKKIKRYGIIQQPYIHNDNG